MASHLIRSVSGWSHDLIEDAHQHHPAALYSISCLFMVWLGWRFYKFHLLPSRHPEDPLEMPYWIPIIGHAVPFFLNSYSFLVRARDAVGKNKDPFAFTVFGEKFYVITQARHATEVDKNMETLSFDEFVQTFIRAAGVSEAGIEAVHFRKIPDGKVDFPNPSEDPIGTLIRYMHVRQLHPGNDQEHLEERFLHSFDRELRLNQIQDGSPAGATSIEISLYQWCADFFTKAGEYAYFGSALAKIDPDFAKMFYIFDELSWQITYQVPGIFAKEKVAAQKHLQQSLKTYFQTPQSQRGKQVWFTEAAENGLRAVNVSDDDIATLFLTVYLTINTNTRRTTFWILTYLLHNSSLIEAVRKETAKAFEGGDLVNPGHIFDHDLCPQLEAIWLETLRVTSSGSSVRCVNKDTTVGGKVLRKGAKIMIPFRLLHLDESVYGPDAPLFKPERFLNKENRARGGNWRPFGGGKTICTGRWVAEHAIKMCVAIVLRRFDLSIIGGAVLPQGDEGTPGLGIMGIKKGEDFKVKITAREAENE